MNVKKVYAFGMLWKNKTEILICQSKTNIDDKILFGNIIHFSYPEMRKIMTRDSTFHYRDEHRDGYEDGIPRSTIGTSIGMGMRTEFHVPL